MIYEYNDMDLEIYDKRFENDTCINIELMDIITLDCIGTCIESPTSTPTPAPTFSPTMENTVEGTVRDTTINLSSTLIAGSTATIQDSANESMDTTINPQTADANLLKLTWMTMIMAFTFFCVE